MVSRSNPFLYTIPVVIGIGVLEIWLALFIETVDDKNRQLFEADYTDSATGVIVHPVFVQTGKA